MLLRLFYLGLRNRLYLERWQERLGFVNIPVCERPRIWIHAVSVGEVQAAIPVVDKLISMYPGYELLMTTVTPTGAAMVRQRFAGNVIHIYFPYDIPFSIKRVLKKINPACLIVMETEIWPNLFHYCHVNNIKVLLANGRMSEKSYRGYNNFKKFIQNVLSVIDRIAAQTEKDAERFVQLGALPERVVVTGSLKFDVKPAGDSVRPAESIRSDMFQQRPVWIAASTHDGEEQIVLDTHRQIIARKPECLCILAPRHPERAAGLLELCDRNGFNTVCTSTVDNCDPVVNILILDILGELTKYYAVADIAFVGGSLLPEFGGHNVLEPASLGIPVLTGEYTRNFEEINQLLCDNNAAIRITDNLQLADKILMLFSNRDLRLQMGQAGRDFVAQNRGSTDRLMVLLSGLLNETK